MLVIEMNPRVSRSSALASKATGFPIAKIAAKLAVGYTLDELQNDITGGATPASFEPTIDYVVTKIPRFTFEKFPAPTIALTTQMKSVGEVDGDRPHVPGVAAEGAARPGDRHGRSRSDRSTLPLAGRAIASSCGDELRDAGRRIACATSPMRSAPGWTLEEVHALTRIDPWFLAQIAGSRSTKRAQLRVAAASKRSTRRACAR